MVARASTGRHPHGIISPRARQYGSISTVDGDRSRPLLATCAFDVVNELIDEAFDLERIFAFDHYPHDRLGA